jgi:hypothetical protein
MATYNCADSTNSAYGAASYGTCTTQVGAPNTGIFQQFLAGGSFTILAPLTAAIILVLVASVVIHRRKAA